MARFCRGGSLSPGYPSWLQRRLLHLRPQIEGLVVAKKGGILLANSNQLYFNNLVKTPCHTNVLSVPPPLECDLAVKSFSRSSKHEDTER